MRGKDKVVGSGNLGPSRSKLIGNRSNQLHLLSSYPLIPFLDEREVTIPVEIHLLSILIFGEVIIPQSDTFLSLFGPSPYTFFFPDTSTFVFPRGG
jgi:hypothetical protein